VEFCDSDPEQCFDVIISSLMSHNLGTPKRGLHWLDFNPASVYMKRVGVLSYL
jgi:hypothetical protein